MLERLHVLECKLQSLFSKEGGPPIIMGPLGLRTAVRAVAGCQYPHSPALRMRTATSFDGEHAQINLKDRAPAHLIDLTSKVGEEQLRRQTVICHQMPALPSALALATTECAKKYATKATHALSRHFPFQNVSNGQLI